MRTPENLRETLEDAFGAPSAEVRTVFVPYRVCPLGAHVDHQLGQVTGFCIDRGMCMAFAPSGDSCVRIGSMEFEGQIEFDLEQVPSAVTGDWGNYARGAAQALSQRHRVCRGFDGVIGGSMPNGGLSSSAAVGIAYLLALEFVNNVEVTPAENIGLDQFIENSYLDLNNGVLDPSVILLNERGKLLFLDCQSGEYEDVSPPSGVFSFDVAIVYSGLYRSLVTTGYNRRVAECREAARWLLDLDGQPSSNSSVLRNVSRDAFERHAERLSDAARKRATHFFTETDRVRRGVEFWRYGDIASFGKLMNESCESSIRNYECGGPHLISLYEILSQTEGVHGTRFSGAGFRGCCVALADPGQRGNIIDAVQRLYPVRHPEVADKYEIHFCSFGGGPETT